MASTVTDWSKYHPYFTKEEMACKHTGLCLISVEFMDALLELRKAYGKPMRVTSGYRDARHPIEARKAARGSHTYGLAIDVACGSAEAFLIAKLAFEAGFQAVGVSQASGKARFLHLEYKRPPGFPSPVLYSY